MEEIKGENSPNQDKTRTQNIIFDNFDIKITGMLHEEASQLNNDAILKYRLIMTERSSSKLTYSLAQIDAMGNCIIPNPPLNSQASGNLTSPSRILTAHHVTDDITVGGIDVFLKVTIS